MDGCRNNGSGAIDFRGSRVGMFLKIGCPVLEIHPGRWGDH